MYLALFTTEVNDEPVSFYSHHLCGGRDSTACALILLWNTEGWQNTCWPFAGCEHIGARALEVIAEPIEGVVVLPSPGPTQTLMALTHRHALAQGAVLGFITFSLTGIWDLRCIKGKKLNFNYT